jgi:hypothetical protein
MTEGQLAEVLLELLDQSKEMKEDIAAYRRMMAQDLTKSFDYQYLLDTMDRHIAFRTQRINAENLSRAIENAGKSTSLAGPKSGLPPCRFFPQGKCKSGKDCPYPHVGSGGSAKNRSATPKAKHNTGGGGSSTGPKGKAGRSRSPAKDVTDVPCFKHLLGICPHTKADCQYAHRKLSENEKAAFEKYKKKVNTAKAQPSAPAQTSVCPEWKSDGTCKAGDGCPLIHSAVQSRPRGRSKSRGKAKAKS